MKVREIRAPRKVKFPFLPIPRHHIPTLLTCTAAELRCYLLIAKMTLGLVDPETNEHVKTARISMGEFAAYGNIGEKTAQFSLRMLQKRGLVRAEGPFRHHRIYSIVVSGDLENEVTAPQRKDEKRGHVTLKTRSAS